MLGRAGEGCCQQQLRVAAVLFVASRPTEATVEIFVELVPSNSTTDHGSSTCAPNPHFLLPPRKGPIQYLHVAPNADVQ
jgi:hypothetical protein